MPANRYFLKGIDYFQLLIDHHNKRFGGPGHEARLAVYFNGKVDVNVISKIISENELCRQLQSLHISKTFGLGYPALIFSEVKKNIPISFHSLETNEIPNECLNIPVDVYNQPPIHIQVFHFKNNQSGVLLTFHHILFDFAGVQSFIYSLSGIKDVAMMPGAPQHSAFLTRARRFFRGIFFTFREANMKMTTTERPLPEKKPLTIVYKEIEFDENETKAVLNNGVQYGLGINKSIHHVASASKALHDVIFRNQQNHSFIWVPVPVNIRRKGGRDAILFNGLSFLFYKLRPSTLDSLDQTIGEIKLQMKDQMYKELPAAFVDFADGYRYVPLPLYYPMMNLPSWGRLSSFSFSTLGNTFTELKELFGVPVAEIKNYPSNSISPGVTFLFYEFRGKLRVMTSWVKGQYSDSEHDMVLKRVKDLMLNKQT